jgi:hypothetical protein
MNVAELIEALGGTNHLATALSVSPAGVRNWRSFGRLPARHYKKVLALATEKGIDEISLDLFWED